MLSLYTFLKDKLRHFLLGESCHITLIQIQKRQCDGHSISETLMDLSQRQQCYPVVNREVNEKNTSFPLEQKHADHSLPSKKYGPTLIKDWPYTLVVTHQPRLILISLILIRLESGDLYFAKV